MWRALTALALALAGAEAFSAPAALTGARRAPLLSSLSPRRSLRGGSLALRASDVEHRLAERGIVLPERPPAAANYAPFLTTGKYVYVSGQLPMVDGEIKYRGRVGTEVSIDDAYQSARLCGLNIIAQVKAACDNDLNKVKRVVKLVGFVQCGAEFHDQPKVINGASDLMNEVFGEAGMHARSAVGTNALPFDVATEIEAVFEIESDIDQFYAAPVVDKRGVPLKFMEGMKVEAVDRMFKDVISVATIREINEREGSCLISFDGWEDGKYDFRCKFDDGDFQPPGTCMRAKARLSPPNGYMGFFDWGSYLEETNSIAAPPSLFTSAKVFPSYKGDVAIKFELWHRMEAAVVPMPPSPEEMERNNQQSNK